MKRIFVSLSLMLIVGLTAALAGDEPRVSEKVKESFQKEFAGAESIKWNDLGEYQMVTFIFSGIRFEAFFNNDGGLEGYARNLLFSQLPLRTIRAVDKRFKGAEFTDVIEVSNTEGTSYWLTAETQNKQFRVKADAVGDILQVKRK